MELESGAKARYYLFDLGDAIVMEQNNCWYKRDKEKHEWVSDNEWMRRYFDAAYDVWEIDYDEQDESFSKVSDINGLWSESAWRWAALRNRRANS